MTSISYHQMLNCLEAVEQQLNEIRENLQNLPEGSLNVYRKGQYVRWRISDAGKQYYIKKADNKTAEKYACKKYLSMKERELINEQNAIKKFLSSYDLSVPKANALFSEESLFRNLLLPYFQPWTEELKKWQQSTYQKNPNHPENLKFSSPSGNILRSKSEVFIDMELFRSKIPYHYEEALKIKNQLFFPDFTIRHPESGEFLYWEHCGKMDSEEYRNNLYKKLSVYASEDILPGINLILTYETKSHPLTPDYVHQVVQWYFSI